jgi:hypothetical protein
MKFEPKHNCTDCAHFCSWAEHCGDREERFDMGHCEITWEHVDDEFVCDKYEASSRNYDFFYCWY